MSMMRLSSASTQPPQKPAMAPMSVPMHTTMIVVSRPTDSEVRVPYTVRANTSQPWKS